MLGNGMLEKILGNLEISRAEKSRCIADARAFLVFSEISRRLGILAIEEHLDYLVDPVSLELVKSAVDGMGSEQIDDLALLLAHDSGAAGADRFRLFLAWMGTRLINEGTNPFVVERYLQAAFGRDRDLLSGIDTRYAEAVVAAMDAAKGGAAASGALSDEEIDALMAGTVKNEG